jgi:hypothetical protein
MREIRRRWAWCLALAIAFAVVLFFDRLSAQTTPGQPAPAQMVAVAPVDEIVPRLLSGPDGGVLRLWQSWIDFRTGGGGVFLAAATPPDAWKRLLEIVPREPGVNTVDPDVAVGPGKDIALAYQWRRHAPRTKQIRIASSADGGTTWTQFPTAVETSGKGFTPKLAWGRGRNLVVVWMDERRAEKAWDVYARRSSDGGATWEPEQVLSRFARQTPADLAARPEMVSDGGDRFWAFWIGLRNGRSRFYLNRSVDGGKTWTDPVEISGASESVFGQRIARSGDRLLMVWQDARIRRDRIYAVTSDDAGVTWTQPTRVDHIPTDSQFAAGPPSLVLAPDGEALVAWHDGRNGRDDVFVTRSTDWGRTWASEDVRIDTDEPGTAFSRYPKITRAADGRLAVVWEDDRGGFEGVYLRVRGVGQTAAWGPEVAVSPSVPRQAKRAPTALWAQDGSLYVAWDVWDFAGDPSHPRRHIDGKVLFPDKK